MVESVPMRKLIAPAALTASIALFITAAASTPAAQSAAGPALLADRIDVSQDFRDFANAYYVADSVVTFDPATRSGTLKWVRNNRYPRLAFNYIEGVLRPFEGVIFPEKEYDTDPVWPFSIQFVSPRTARIRVKTGPDTRAPEPSLMLAGDPAVDASWQYAKIDGGHRYTSSGGSLAIFEKPWRIELRDAAGKLLTRTQSPVDFESTLSPALPFSYIRRASDHSRSVAAVFSLSAGEKLFGGGESFTGLDKRGQKLVLSVNDANGAESDRDVQADPVPHEQSWLRDVHAHVCSGDLRHRRDLPRQQRAAARRRRARPVCLSRHAERGPGRIHHDHRQVADAAALVVRLLDEPHHLLLRRGSARTSPPSCASTAFPSM